MTPLVVIEEILLAEKNASWDYPPDTLRITRELVAAGVVAGEEGVEAVVDSVLGSVRADFDGEFHSGVLAERIAAALGLEVEA